MKITRKQLRQIIQEEIKLVRRPPIEIQIPDIPDKPDWNSLKGTPIGDATLRPSLRGEFKVTDAGWKDLERLARAAGETIRED